MIKNERKNCVEKTFQDFVGPFVFFGGVGTRPLNTTDGGGPASLSQKKQRESSPPPTRHRACVNS